MSADVDYHVGLVRGYMLALNAPTQILHALDILLTDYRSRAGSVIGARHEPVATKPAVIDTRPHTPAPASRSAPIERENIEKKESTAARWTDEDHKTMTEMYQKGSSISDIAEKIARTPASIYKRLSDNNIKRAAHV